MQVSPDGTTLAVVTISSTSPSNNQLYSNHIKLYLTALQNPTATPTEFSVTFFSTTSYNFYRYYSNFEWSIDSSTSFLSVPKATATFQSPYYSYSYLSQIYVFAWSGSQMVQAPTLAFTSGSSNYIAYPSFLKKGRPSASYNSYRSIISFQNNVIDLNNFFVSNPNADSGSGALLVFSRAATGWALTQTLNATVAQTGFGGQGVLLSADGSMLFIVASAGAYSPTAGANNNKVIFVYGQGLSSSSSSSSSSSATAAGVGAGVASQWASSSSACVAFWLHHSSRDKPPVQGAAATGTVPSTENPMVAKGAADNV